jgi:integrase
VPWSGSLRGVGGRIVLAVVEQLPDGSYLSETYHQRDIHHTHGGMQVRVVEYTIAGHDDVYRLITTILDSARFLFPVRPRTSTGVSLSLAAPTYRLALYRWLRSCDIRDEHGKPVHFTPHQWRHALGTALINKDVPQEVVRLILDHESPHMTAHYANPRELHQTGEKRQVAC